MKNSSKKVVSNCIGVAIYIQNIKYIIRQKVRYILCIDLLERLKKLH